MKILPVKVRGAEATFAVVLDDGSLFFETYTNTPDGKTSSPHDESSLKRCQLEFQGLLDIKAESPKTSPKEVDDAATYFNPTDFKKALTNEEVESALESAIPFETIEETIADVAVADPS